MTKFSFDVAIAAVAATQEWVFSRDQAQALGATDVMIRQRVQSGRWEAVAPGVYRLPGSADTWSQRLWVAALAVGPASIVSHEAAAAMHGLPGYPCGPVVLIAPHGSHHRVRGAVVHQTRDPWAVSAQPFGALRVTTPARTLIDLAGIRARPSRLRAGLDEAITRRLCTYGDIRDELGALARRGKRGIRLLTSVLDEHQGEPVKQSQLERAFFALFDQFGGPRPVPQWPFPCREDVSGCADAGFPAALLAVETDGRRWHSRVQDLRRDHERDANAARHGVQVLRILYEHVVGAPEQTWQLVQDTRRTRLRQLGRLPAEPLQPNWRQ